MSRYASLLIISLSFLLVNCAGSKDQEIRLELDQKSLKGVETLTLYVTTNKSKKGKTLTCQMLLDKKTSFEEKSLSIESKQVITLNPADQVEINLSQLKTGEKLFMVAGFSKKDKKKPLVFGCQKGLVAAGKKLLLAIYLANY